MWMPASKLVDPQQIQHADNNFYGGYDNMRKVKLHEMHNSEYNAQRRPNPRHGENTLVNSIKEEGVREPLEMHYSPHDNTMALLNGHHRAFAAHSIDPKMEVPVRF